MKKTQSGSVEFLVTEFFYFSNRLGVLNSKIHVLTDDFKLFNHCKMQVYMYTVNEKNQPRYNPRNCFIARVNNTTVF